MSSASRAARDALADRIVAALVRRVLRPVARRGAIHGSTLENGRRLVLVQLDGVSRARLQWALERGHMPRLAARLASGTHVVSSCRSGAPASTPAFQAGLFYGVSPSVPGFVWFDRESGREVRMDRPEDAARVERRLGARNPGLLRGGTSYFSVFSGGAGLREFSLAGLPEFSLAPLSAGFNVWDHLATGIVHSFTAVKMTARLAWEVAAGLLSGAIRTLSLGRLKHEPRFFVHRLVVAAFMRELALQGAVIDMVRGIPIVYADFIAYDEFAHRRGPASPAAVANLASMDRALAAVFATADALPDHRYDVYVLSDHGHVATTPFESLTGLSLPEYLALADGGIAVPRALEQDDALRLAQTRGARTAVSHWPKAARRFVGSRLDALEHRLVGRPLGFVKNDRVATAEAGDLAHVYFVGERQPIPLEAIRMRHPGVLAALRESRAIGIVAVRSGRRGVAIVGGDELDLSDPRDVERLPHPEPELVAEYLADLLAMPESGDLVVQGWRGPGEIPVAYAWEFGSHGGVAPEEIETFVVHPRGVDFRFDEVRRPDALYRFFDSRYRRPAEERRRAPGLEPERLPEREWA